MSFLCVENLPRGVARNILSHRTIGTAVVSTIELLKQTLADNDRVLVIPMLQRWLLRNEQGLGLIRALLDAVDAGRRRVIVESNTWTWEFLCKAAQANLVLPPGLTFQPFGARELHDWFQTLADDDVVDNFTFRLSSSGIGILNMPSQSW